MEADGDAADTAAIAQNRQLDEAERTAITEQRAIQRTETLVELGLHMKPSFSPRFSRWTVK